MIEGIHAKVLEAVTTHPELFDMGGWHKMTDCGTSHCRAGWVVHLAGEAGYAFEKQTNTQFAAMQIYKASSPIRVSNYSFYEGNEIALAHIKECAEKEDQLTDKGTKRFNVITQNPTDNNKKFERVVYGQNKEVVETEVNLMYGTDNVLSIEEIE